MRPLTDEETKTMFEKLSKYIGENIKLLVDRPDGTYCFRLHKDHVYYVSEKILKLATNVARDQLVSLGSCFGKFTKTQKFRLHITALDYLAPYAKYKVWVKPGAEQSFLYGNHVLKSGLGRITENTAQYQGVIVYSMADVPLAKKKRKHLEETDKIEETLEKVKNDEDDGQEKPSDAKKPKKRRFLARLQNAWTRISKSMRCCISNQEEEDYEERPGPSRINEEEVLPGPSGISVEKVLPGPSRIKVEVLPGPSRIIMEEVLLGPSRINKEEEVLPGPSGISVEKVLPGPSGISMDDVFPGPSQINAEEVLPGLSKINLQEVLPGPSGISAEEVLPGPSEINVVEVLPEPSGINVVEELPGPSGINTADRKAHESSKEEEKDEIPEESQVITADHQEKELVMDIWLEQGIIEEYQHLQDVIHSLEDQCIQYHTGQQEILAAYDGIHDLIQSTEDGTKDNQTTSCGIPGPGHSSSGALSSQENEKKTIIKTTEDREACGAEGSSNNSSSLEEISEELYISAKTSQSDSSDNRSDFCTVVEDDTSEELYKSTQTSQSNSSPDGKPTTSDICMEEPHQSGSETPATIPLTLECFTFHQKLGKGGFGEVYLAKDSIRNERVAIKVSNKRNFTIKGYTFAERHILKNFQKNPYLIHGLGAFHTTNYVYHVMEFPTGGTLKDFINNSANFPLHIDMIKFMIAEIICGTEFLHGKGIIHRDLKPANILLTEEGHVKIIDFGLALMLSGKWTKRRCRGTPGYAAPELVMGEKHGRGVDYFAIGVIMYELTTYWRPFPGRNRTEIEQAVLHRDPRYPQSLSYEIVNLLEGLLCKDQKRRYGIISEVRRHWFFNDINWLDVEARRVAPPSILTASSVDRNVNDTLPYAEEKTISIVDGHQKFFNNFSYVCAEWSQHYHSAIVETKY